MESIDELARKLKVDVGKWEEEVFNWTCSLAQEVAKDLLESVDEELMKEKEQSLKADCLKEHRITTVFGDVRVRRRLYRDSNGLPALHGPHHNRPWAQILRALTREVGGLT